MESQNVLPLVARKIIVEAGFHILEVVQLLYQIQKPNQRDEQYLRGRLGPPITLV